MGGQQKQPADLLSTDELPLVLGFDSVLQKEQNPPGE